MAISAKKFVEKLGLPPGALIYVGDRKFEGLKITLVKFAAQDTKVEFFDSWPKCLEGLATDCSYFWLHVEGLSDVKVMESIGRHFGIHYLALEDILNSHHRPKMSDFEDFVQFLFKLVTVENKTGVNVNYEHAAAIVSKNFVITFQERRTDYFNKLRERCLNDSTKFRKFGAAYLAFAVLDYVVDHYYLAVGKIEVAADDVEATILQVRNEDYLESLYDLKWETVLLKKLVSPMRDFNKQLLKSPPELLSQEEIQFYFRDLDDHLVQVVDLSDGIKETVNNLFDISNSHASHRRNVVMSILTAVSTIFLPLNFFAGVFGMNFNNIPFADMNAGFYYVCGFMSVIALTLALIFKWKRWL